MANFFERIFGSTPNPEPVAKSGSSSEIAPGYPADQQQNPTNWANTYSLSYPSAGSLFNWGWGIESDTGQRISPLAALQSRAVYACLRVLGENMAKLPLTIKQKQKKGGYKLITNHPLNAIIRKPNRWQTYFEFIYGLVWSVKLRGNGYAYIKRTRTGAPKEIIFIHPDTMTVLPPVNGKIYYWFRHKCLKDNQDIFANSEDMIHIKDMSIDGGFMGVSCIHLCQTIIGLDLSTRTHAATIFRQGTTLTGLLKHPGKLSEIAMANIRRGWQAAFGGNQKSHQVAVVSEGMDFIPMAMTNEQSQLLQARQANTEEIASLFGVPLHKIGNMDKASFSNVEDMNQSFIDDSLMSLAKRIEEAIETKCLTAAELVDYEVRFDFDVLLRGNSLMRAQANQLKKSNGIISANEWRESEGMSPDENPDSDKLVPYQNLMGKGPADSMGSTSSGSLPKADQ